MSTYLKTNDTVKVKMAQGKMEQNVHARILGKAEEDTISTKKLCLLQPLKVKIQRGQT